MQKAKNKITLATLDEKLTLLFNTLQETTTSRFVAVDSRFADINSRFDDVNSRFDDVNSRFDDVNSRFDDVNSRLDQMNASFNRMAVRLVDIQSTVEEHSAILYPVRDRVDSLHGMVEHLLVRTERLEQEYMMMTAALRRLEASHEIE